MKIAVTAGTGPIGSQVVRILTAAGDEAVPHSPATGLDLVSGKACPRRAPTPLVNLTNSPTFDDASPVFFRTTMLPARCLRAGHRVDRRGPGRRRRVAEGGGR